MGINVCVFSGNIGGDCEQKFLPSGACVANFSLPVKQGYGEHEKTSWVRCVLLGKKAESLPQYLTKGCKVTVTGEFVLNEWQDNQGQKRSTPELIVRDLELPPRQQTGQNPAQQPQTQQMSQGNPYQKQTANPSPMASNPQNYNQQQAQNCQQQQQGHPVMNGAQNIPNQPQGGGSFNDDPPF